MFATTHTHSGISMTYNWNGLDQYKAKVQNAMIQTAKDALADMAPAKLSYGSSFEDDLVFVRHYKLNDGSVTSSGVGYGIPAYECGCYESYTTKFARGAGEEIADTFLDMLQFMKDGGSEEIGS